VLQRPIETTPTLLPFELGAASGSLGSKLPFAALSTNGSSADKPAVGAKFQMSGLIAIAAVGTISRMCQKAT